jgi:ribosomal protein S18 acetylase RimI-like enzyme
MNIRLATQTDLTDLAAFAQEAYAAEFGASMSSQTLANELQLKSAISFAAMMARCGDDFQLAETAGRLAGYIGLRDALGRIDVKGRAPTARDQALNGIYVHPDFQGRGLGRNLMNAAYAQPRFRNAENVYLSWEENKRCLFVLFILGFRLVGTRNILSNGKVVGEDIVMMRSSAAQPSRIEKP